MYQTTFFLMVQTALSASNPISISNLPFKPNSINHIEKSVIVTNTKMHEFKIQGKKKQKLNFKIAGLHKKSCVFALRKLSHYENYHRYLNFVKKSNYNEKKERVDFYLSSSILPYSMRLNFKIPRITKPGAYSFTFDRGFLKGLIGEIHVIPHKKRCLFFAHAHWQGDHSGINDTLFEFFTNVLTKVAMENLFRISSIY